MIEANTIVTIKNKQLGNEEITDILVRLRNNSYVPFSDYSVAAILEIEQQGSYLYFFGVNTENVEHSLSMHAEESAVAAAITALGPYIKLSSIWVMGGESIKTETVEKDELASCCGKCRQCISSYSVPEAKVVSVSLTGQIKTHVITDLLPYSYSWQNLPHVSSIIEKERKSVTVSLDINHLEGQLVRRASLNNKEIFDWLSSLCSVDFISRIKQSVILYLDNGYYVAGVTVENPAFTGFNAMQAAVSIATTCFGTYKIKEIWSLSSSKNQAIPANGFQPLSHSALQVLYEFAYSSEIPVHFFSSNEDITTMGLQEANTLVVSSDNIYFS